MITDEFAVGTLAVSSKGIVSGNGAGHTTATNGVGTVSRFFQAGGALKSGHPSYIVRAADDQLYETLWNRDYALILAPRQMGKSSLMERTRTRLQEEDVSVAIVDLSQLGGEGDSATWFGTVVMEIGYELGSEGDNAAWWSAHEQISPPVRFARWMQEVLLAEIPAESPVVLFFDEIDSVLPLPFRDDFFLTLRALFNARAHKPALERLSVALVGVASPSDLVENKTRSPYNIGTLISLEDFPTGHDALPTFREALSGTDNPDANAVVDRILHWTGGQPFLTQQFAQIAQGWNTEQRTAAHVDAEVNERYLTGEATQNTHLKFIRDYLLEAQGTLPQSAVRPTAESADSSPAAHDTVPAISVLDAPPTGYDTTRIRETLLLYRDVLDHKSLQINPASESQNRLRLAGVIRNDPATGCLAPRNPIYVARFGKEWIERNLPADPLADTPLRRWQNAPSESKKDYLLRGSALRDAEAEAVTNPQSIYRTDAGQEFLLLSRRREEEREQQKREEREQKEREKEEREQAERARRDRQNRIRTTFLITLLSMGFISTGVSLYFAYNAEANAHSANNALKKAEQSEARAAEKEKSAKAAEQAAVNARKDALKYAKDLKILAAKEKKARINAERDERRVEKALLIARKDRDQLKQNIDKMLVAYNKDSRAKQEMNNPIRAIPNVSVPISNDAATRDSAAYLESGRANFHLKRYQRAIADFSKSRELTPTRPEVYYARGLGYEAMSDYKNALGDFQKVLSLSDDHKILVTSIPGFEDLDKHLARCYAGLKQDDAAIRSYTNAIGKFPQDGEAYFNRGVLFARQKKIDQAVSDYKMAIKLEPKLSDAYYNLGTIYLDQQRYSQVIETFEKYLQLVPLSTETARVRNIIDLCREKLNLRNQKVGR